MGSKPASYLVQRSLFFKSSGNKQSLNTNRNSSPTSSRGLEICENNELPNYILHEVEHYRQRFNWDCGVSCVLMLLSQEPRKHFLEKFADICKEEGFGESTWTIDLCYLLKNFDIKHEMYSTVIGVNEDFHKLTYYNNIIELDRQRVQLRFEEAAARDIHIRKGELSNHRIKKHLIEHGPVIVLVDNGLLVCDLCKHNKLKYEFRKVFGGSYCGHYILVVGYSRGKILYRDPGLSKRICATSFARFTEARVAPGTDQDLVLIYNNYSHDDKLNEAKSIDIFNGRNFNRPINLILRYK